MRGLWLLLLVLTVALTARADPVDLQLVSGLTVRAEYRPGVTDKPAVMILHGFLQTYDFPTVHRLIESLSRDGYTVLAPNLSLGVSNRRQSLACEAIHTHTMAGDIQEIDAWVNWLAHKQPRRIILIGHSFGSVHALAYLNSRPNAPISKYIGISIIETRMQKGEAERGAELKSLQRMIRKGDKRIIARALGYCQQFNAIPASLASYLEWSQDRIIHTVLHLPVAGLFIMGGRDDRIGSDWLGRLRKTHIQIKVITGANHFMDGEHEFDLHDMVTHGLQDRM